MASHFIRLYLLVVLAIAAVSWHRNDCGLRTAIRTMPPDASLAALFGVVEDELRRPQLEQRGATLARLADESKLGMELLARNESPEMKRWRSSTAAKLRFMEAGGTSRG